MPRRGNLPVQQPDVLCKNDPLYQEIPTGLRPSE